MNLESSVKFHFAKSTQINDSPRATASDTLTGTDVMAAQGMVQSRAKMGFAAFLGKMGVSNNDREKAIEMLTQYANETCDKVPAIRKLSPDIKPVVMQTLAICAYEDYARSAASTRSCDCCEGKGFIDADVFSMKAFMPTHAKEMIKMSLDCGLEVIPSKYESRRQVKEVVRTLCYRCKGKKVISNACQCNGKGKVLDKEKTILQGGVPAYKICSRCNGLGYSRLLPEAVRKIICDNAVEIPETTWRRAYKGFFEGLVVELIQQEGHANNMLAKVTAEE